MGAREGRSAVNLCRVLTQASGAAFVVGVVLSAVPYGSVTGEPTQELSPGRACAPVLSGSDSSFIPDDPGRVSEWSMAVCKRRPDNPDTLLAVVPMSAETGELRDLQILVIDLPRQTVVARRVERNVLEGDAIYVNAVALDTARYTLTPKQRAFGVRVEWKGSSGPNPYSRETLSLYTVSGPRIERNLAELVTWERSGEWDMECTGTFSSVSRTIPSPTHWLILPPGYEGSRSVALKSLRGLMSEAHSYIEPPAASPDLTPAVTAEQALADLPPIFARKLLAEGSLSRGARRFDTPVSYGTDATSTYSKLMRSWPLHEASPHGIADHVIRYLPRDYDLFALMNPGDQYDTAANYVLL